MVNYGILWGKNVRKTHRNGTKWLIKVKKMQNLWQFKSLCPCQKKTLIVIQSESFSTKFALWASEVVLRTVKLLAQ